LNILIKNFDLNKLKLLIQKPLNFWIFYFLFRNRF
jgi:hypothetical protein